MEPKTDRRKPFMDRPLGPSFALMPETAVRNLLFYSNGELHDYAKDEGNQKDERAQCVAELFVREFLKKGSAEAEINSILPDGELESFRNKLGETAPGIHEENSFPLDVLWEPADDFSRICEITVRKVLRERCEKTDGFIPVYLLSGNESFFIPFHFEQSGDPSEKGRIVDLAGQPILMWQPAYEQLFPDGKYWCIVHCDQEGLKSPGQEHVFTGDSLMLPLYLAYLRKEGRLAYNPLRLVATGEIEDGHLKSVRTNEKAAGFHADFDCNSYFVYPESTQYSSTVRNEIALPKMDLDQLEVFFRIKGFFVRTGSEREKGICTVTPAISSCFVGRWEELMDLDRLVRRHHIPVITGEAGVGKSELAVAYAYLYAERFPQGRFMIPMQGVHNWPDAMAMMVEKWCNVYHQTTPEELGLPGDFGKLPPDEKRAAAFRMLAIRARRGPLLLLLDNLEDLDLISEQGIKDLTDSAGRPDNLHVIATTRLKQQKVAVQTPVEIGNLKESDALDLFCKICKNAFSFTQYPMADGRLLLDWIPEGGRPEPVMVRRIEQEYAALKDTIRLLNGHVWSLEIIAGRFAKIYEHGDCDIKKEYEEIRKNLLVNLKGRRHHRNSGDNAEILLNPTLEQILKQDEVKEELGQKIMRLAEYASFFPPEQIPEYALRELWKQELIDTFGKDEVLIEEDGISWTKKAFDYAKTLLMTYRIINDAGPIFKMHRLTREVLQNRLSEEEKDDIIFTMGMDLNMMLRLGVDSKSDYDDFDSSTEFEEDEMESEADGEDDFSWLPKAISVQQIQPLCGWMDVWWKKSVIQDINSFDIFVFNLIKECIKLNMYSEAEHLLSFDYQSVTDDKSFWGGYYEIKGQLYLNQRLYEKAEEAVSRSIAFYRELEEEDPDSISLHCLNLVHDLRNLALIHYRASGRDENQTDRNDPKVFSFVQRVFGQNKAEKELREALRIARKDPDNAGAVIEVLTDLANLYYDLSEYDKAEKEINKALKIYQEKPAASTLTSGDKLCYPEALKTLANLFSARGKYEDAEQALNDALDEYDDGYYNENRPEEYKPYVAEIKCKLSVVHYHLGSDEKAEKELLECLSIYRDFAKRSPMVFAACEAGTLNDLAAFYYETGRNAEAEEKWIDSLKICREHLMGNPELFMYCMTATLIFLASASFELTRQDELESVLAELPDLFRQLAEVDPERYTPDLATVLDSLAGVHDKLGRADEAEKERMEAAALRERMSPNKRAKTKHA